jgi:hypothetical protein
MAWEIRDYLEERFYCRLAIEVHLCLTNEFIGGGNREKSFGYLGIDQLRYVHRESQ